MAYQFSTAVRNAQIDAIEATIGSSPILDLRSGLPPADCAAADSGTLLASMSLPADWMAAATSGTKTLLGSWSDLLANASGTFGHFRIRQGGTVHWQGTASGPGGGGDIVMDSATVTGGQEVRVTAMTLIAGGA
jgi:hypothetical protein